MPGKHHPPEYYGYRGGFADVTVCAECGSTALYEDQHPADPCPSCGGTLRECVGKWVPPTYRWKFFWRTCVNPGHWELRK